MRRVSLFYALVTIFGFGAGNWVPRQHPYWYVTILALCPYSAVPLGKERPSFRGLGKLLVEALSLASVQSMKSI